VKRTSIIPDVAKRMTATVAYQGASVFRGLKQVMLHGCGFLPLFLPLLRGAGPMALMLWLNG
jgi:hypothetical protein